MQYADNIIAITRNDDNEAKGSKEQVMEKQTEKMISVILGV